MKKFVCGLVVLISLLVVTGCGFMSQINNSADVKGTELKFDVPVVAGNKCVIALDNSQNWAEVISTRTNQPDFSTDIANNIINVNYTGSDTVAKETKNVGVQICSKDGREVYKQVDVQMTVGGWKKMTTSDFTWNKTQGNSNYNESTGVLQVGSGGTASGIFFSEDIQGIRFTVCADSVNPGYVTFVWDKTTEAHNGFLAAGANSGFDAIYYCDSRSTNGWTAYSSANDFTTAVRGFPKNTPITINKVDDTMIAAKYDGSENISVLNFTTHEQYIGNKGAQDPAVRFGFGNYWSSSNSYKIQDIYVFR